MPYPKPTTVPWWTRTGTRTEPTELKKDDGWQTDEKPPAQIFNWIDGWQSDWIGYFDERVGDNPALVNPEYEFVIKNPYSGQPQLRTLEDAGVGVDMGLNVGFYAPAAVDDAVSVGDLGFAMLGMDTDTKQLAFNYDMELMRCVRSAHRLEWVVNSTQRAALSQVGLRLGIGTPTLPFHVTESVAGELGGVAGNYVDISSYDYLSADTIDLLTYGYRHAAGSDWTTASMYMHNGVEAGDRKGFIRFSGSAVASGPYGIGSHVGIGVGTRGSDVAMWVDATNTYARSLLPYAPRLGSVGTYGRPWGELWLCDDLTAKNGYVKTSSYLGATDASLNLQVYNGPTLLGSVRVYGEATYSALDCLGVTFVKSLGYHARYGDPVTLPNRGFEFENAAGVRDVTGLFYELSPAAIRLYKQNRRMVDISGRTGNIDDVQLTLGRGSGAGAGVADLRDYACVCQDFLNGDAVTLERGDMVYILATGVANHAVARVMAPVPAAMYAIGVVVDATIAVGAIGRIATSGIVQARNGNIAVARGDFVECSTTVTGRVASAAFSPKTVGQALQSAASPNTYFRMLIRFGG